MSSQERIEGQMESYFCVPKVIILDSYQFENLIWSNMLTSTSILITCRAPERSVMAPLQKVVTNCVRGSWVSPSSCTSCFFSSASSKLWVRSSIITSCPTFSSWSQSSQYERMNMLIARCLGIMNYIVKEIFNCDEETSDNWINSLKKSLRWRLSQVKKFF